MSVHHSPSTPHNNSIMSPAFEHQIMEQLKQINAALVENSQKLHTMERKLDTIDEMQKRIDETFKKYEELKHSTEGIKNELKTAIIKMESVNNSHNTDIARLFSICHLNCLQLTKVPQLPNENLYTIYHAICNIVGVPAPPKLESIYRNKSQTTTGAVVNADVNNLNPRTIMIKFENKADRNRIFNFYLKNSRRFTTKALGFESDERVYLMEFIHSSVRSLYNEAQVYKKQHNLKKVQIRNGMLYVIPNNQQKFFFVKDTTQLYSLMSTFPIAYAAKVPSNEQEHTNQFSTNTNPGVSSSQNVSYGQPSQTPAIVEDFNARRSQRPKKATTFFIEGN